MALLKEKQNKLAAVEAKIAELQKTYDDSVAEKQKLERNIATTAGRLKRSSKLTTALADEQVFIVCMCRREIERERKREKKREGGREGGRERERER